jgi:hypothetical protein
MYALLALVATVLTSLLPILNKQILRDRSSGHELLPSLSTFVKESSGNMSDQFAATQFILQVNNSAIREEKKPTSCVKEIRLQFTYPMRVLCCQGITCILNSRVCLSDTLSAGTYIDFG